MLYKKFPLSADTTLDTIQAGIYFSWRPIPMLPDYKMNDSEHIPNTQFEYISSGAFSGRMTPGTPPPFLSSSGKMGGS